MEQNKTREYTLKQRILTLFAIAIGIAFAWGVCGEYMWSGEPDMGSAMLIYCLLYTSMPFWYNSSRQRGVTCPRAKMRAVWASSRLHGPPCLDW